MTTRSVVPHWWALAAIAATLTVMPNGAQEPLLWGSLKPGPHAVGYRVLVRLDHTREYDPEYAPDPTQPPTHRPRPILTYAGCPARKTDTRPLAYREYLDVPSGEATLAPFGRRLAPHIRGVVCEELTGKMPARLTPAETAAVDRFQAAKTVGFSKLKVSSRTGGRT